MKTNLEWLENRVKQLDKERDALVTLVSIYHEKAVVTPAPAAAPKPKRRRRRTHKKVVKVEKVAKVAKVAAPKPAPVKKSGPSITSQVMNAVAELVKKTGTPVGTQAIYDYLEANNVSLGKTKNKKAFLGVLLAQELKKKEGRLKKVDRGIYDMK